MRAKREYIVIAGLIFVLLASLIPSLSWHRKERRDSIRRSQLIHIKDEIEQINNKEGAYPHKLDVGEHEYIVKQFTPEGATAWYLRARLENEHEPERGFNYEHNVYYRYVNERGTTYFDICGGTLTCGVDPDTVEQ